MPTPHSCVRIASTELAQLQYSVQALGLQNECVIPKIHSSDAKENARNISHVDCAPTDTGVLSLNISGSETLDINLLSANESQDDELEELSALSTSGSSPFVFSAFSFEGLSNRPDWEDMDTSASSNSIDFPPLPPKFHRATMAELKKHNERIPIRSLPMSREVSLYQGLPNGWQLNSNYDDAIEEFLSKRDEGLFKDIKREPDSVQNRKRPRIPSIAPLGSAKFNLTHVAGGGN